jgi:adenylate kinase
MNLIFLGPPGAGKGTLAAKASVELRVPHISTGEIFRASIRERTPLGLQVKGIIDSGGLVPDELTIALVRERLSAEDAANGWILDGFPRTIPQARALEAMKGANAAVNFDVGDDAVLERLSGRRVCPACSRNFHVSFLKPAKEGVCDDCGAALMIREDDKPEAIKKRLEVYRAQTEPLIGYYRGLGKLVDIDASGRPDEVLERFRAAMDGAA